MTWKTVAGGVEHVTSRTAPVHAEIYQTAGTLIGVLVWCSLTCRVLLRATAWASTASAHSAAQGGP